MSADKRKVLKPLKEMETIWHPDSGLVFKSKTEKVVTGRWINSEFYPLDEEAIELCAQWSFKYDQELYDELMADEDEGGDEGGDEACGEEDEACGEVDETEEVKVSNDDLNNLTSNFTNNLNSYFQTLTNDYCAKISILENKLSNKSLDFDKMTEDRDKLKVELSMMTEDHDKIKEECDKLKAKFEGFKSFFNN